MDKKPFTPLPEHMVTYIRQHINDRPHTEANSDRMRKTSNDTRMVQMGMLRNAAVQNARERMDGRSN